ANLARDSQILQYAREIALRILEEDGTLNHRDNLILKEQLKKFSKTQFNWSNIS
ncbi:MAG: hypothetical protein Q8862_13185, partial [Bacteroidota bacterium]|nr:hypothetical protein [Bacteroidota bacterium]